jgi:ATP-dependent Clp protease protease subunit
MNTIVLETTPQGDSAIDVYEKLANDRILFLTDYLTDTLASELVATILLKQAEDQQKKITLFINSGGGHIRNVFMLYDIINSIECPIETVCMGAAHDEIGILLMSGRHGLRLATPNSIISISQLTTQGTSYTNLSDAHNVFAQIAIDNKRMMSIVSKSCNKPLSKVMKDFEKRVYMNAQQALKYGIIDKIITPNKG